MTFTNKPTLNITNRTSLTDLQHFHLLISYLYEYFKNEINEGSEFQLHFNPNVIGIRIQVAGEENEFFQSVDEFFECLIDVTKTSDNIFKNTIGQFYKHHFKIDDYEVFDQDEIDEFAENKAMGLILNAQKSNSWVNTSRNIQLTQTSMAVEAIYDSLVADKIVEHRTIVNNLIDFHIAYIHLAIIYQIYGVASKLYLIEDNTKTIDDATLYEKIGNAPELDSFSDSKTKSRNNGMKFLELILKRAEQAA